MVARRDTLFPVSYYLSVQAFPVNADTCCFNKFRFDIIDGLVH